MMTTLNELIEEYGYGVLPLGKTISLIDADGSHIDRAKILHNPLTTLDEKYSYIFYFHDTDLAYFIEDIGESYVILNDFKFKMDNIKAGKEIVKYLETCKK